jgi:hypothetical protein
VLRLKYYILNILRIQVSGKIMPDITSNKFIKYCETLEQALWNDNKCKDVLLGTLNIIDEAVNGDYDRAVAKTVGFSNAINNCFK